MSKNHKFPNKVEPSLEEFGIIESVAVKVPESDIEYPKPNFSANSIGIAKDKSGRFHLFEITFDPDTLVPGSVTSLYSDMLEEEMREKFSIESARRNFQWRY